MNAVDADLQPLEQIWSLEAPLLQALEHLTQRLQQTLPPDEPVEVGATAGSPMRQECCAASVLGAVFVLLLHRYCGLDSLLFGWQVRRATTKADTGDEDGPIHLLNSSLTAQSSLVDSLLSLQAQHKGASHGEAAWPSSTAGGRPVLPSLVVLGGQPMAASAAAAGQRATAARPSLQPAPGALATAQLPAELVFEVRTVAAGGGEAFQLHIQADQHRFAAEALSCLAADYHRFLQALLAEPEAPVLGLPWVSAESLQWVHQLSRQALPAQVRALSQAPWPEQTLHQMFEAQARRTPERVALVLESEVLRYRELDEWAEAWARLLRHQGVRPDTLVAVLLPRSLQMVVALLAVLKAGGAYLPLEPDMPALRLLGTLQDAAAPILLSHSQLPLLDAVRIELPLQLQLHCVDQGDWAGPDQRESEAARRSAPALAPAPAPATAPEKTTTTSTVGADNLCYVIYTSGSTGTPKGTLLSHGAICNHMRWMRAEYGFGPEDHVLQKTPYSFDASVWEIFLPLLCGARLVLARPGGHRDMPYLAATIVQQQVTTLQLVPSVLQLLLDEPGFAACTSLSRVYCGGEALATALVRRFKARHGAQLHNLYGPTECCIDTTTFNCSAKPQREPEAAMQPIGKPIWNTCHYVLDEQLRPLPVGVAGELCIGGAGLARSYLNRPALTAEKFVPNPFDEGGEAPRLYRTGDLVRCHFDGQFEYIGRLDAQVKLNGARIELGEIEAALQALPGVQQAAVTLREDQPGRRYLAAYLVAPGWSRCQLAPLRQQLALRLPASLLPAAWELLEAMPLTPNGKLDRRALPLPQRQADPVSEHAGLSPTEALLATIWAEVLGLSKPVARTDDFLALGGDSLGWMQMSLLLRQRGGDELEWAELMETTQLKALAEVVDSHRARVRPAAQLDAHDRSMAALGTAAHRLELAGAAQAALNGPASFEQASFASSARALRGWPVFNTSELMLFSRPVLLGALRSALAALVQQHEILRTVLQLKDGVWTQAVLTLPDESADAKSQPGAHRDVTPPARPILGLQLVAEPALVLEPDGALSAASLALVQARLQNWVQQPLELQNSPPRHWYLLHAGDSRAAPDATAQGETECWLPSPCVLVAIVHHSLTDGHSTDSRSRDLLQHYESALASAVKQAPAGPSSERGAAGTASKSSPAVRYLDYACWQHARLLAGDFAVNRAYWEQHLADAPPPLQLPTDRPRRAFTRWHGARVSLQLPAAQGLALKRLAARHRATLYMTLATAFCVLLAQETGQTDLVFGTSVANRFAPDSAQMAGCTIGAIALRVQVQQQLNLAELLAQVRQVCLRAYAHQDLPMGLALAPLAQGSRLLAGPPLGVWLELHDQRQGWQQRFGHLGVQRLDLDRGISESEFSLEVDDAAQGLLCHLQYKTELFDGPRMQSCLRRFADLLDTLVQQPMTPVASLIGASAEHGA